MRLERCYQNVYPRSLAAKGVVRITVFGPVHQCSRDLGTICLRSTLSSEESGAGSRVFGFIVVVAERQPKHVSEEVTSERRDRLGT